MSCNVWPVTHSKNQYYVTILPHPAPSLQNTDTGSRCGERREAWEPRSGWEGKAGRDFGVKQK